MFFTISLKKNRKKKGLTQRELAALSGVSQQYIVELEKSDRNKSPTLDIVAKLAIALGVCPHILLEYDKSEFCKKCTSICSIILLIVCLLIHRIPIDFISIG